MPLPTTATLVYSATALWGLTPTQLAALMSGVRLYGGGSLSAAPPPNAPLLPTGTSDAVFDCLFGCNVAGDATAQVGSTPLVTRTLTLNLRPASGAPTASSFVSLGNAGTFTSPTNNPPFPPRKNYLSPPPNPSAWTGCVVSSSPQDHAASLFVLGSGARTLRIFYLDTTNAALFEDIALTGTTPVNLVNTNKYVITDVEILTTGPSGAAPLGQVNFWSGPVDPVTGLPTGKLVGYLPQSYFANFSFQQLTGWTPAADLDDLRKAYQLVAPDYKYPNATVTTPVGTPPPPPSKALLNYPPPSSVANPNPPDFSGGVAKPVTDIVGRKGVRVTALGGDATPNAVNDPLLTPLPNFTNPNLYMKYTFYGPLPFVPNPFQGLGLGAFAKVLGMPASRVALPGTVSMTVTLA